MIVDAGIPVAASNRSDPNRLRAQALLANAREPLIVPAPVTAEIDFMLTDRGHTDAARAFITDIVGGLYVVECLTRDEYMLVQALERRYAALTPGLADLSVVVLAFRLNTLRIATLDQRHFRAITPLQGGAFTLLPWDE